MSGAGLFAQSFVAAPIILTEGLAAGLIGGMPITTLFGGAAPKSVDEAFANFVPVPGGSLIDNAVGTYPFANQAIAANAIIANGLTVSMRMICPVRDTGGYANKLAVITALRSSLANHNNLGGTYTVATPSFYYESCLLIKMFDASDGESKQSQTEWQLDFYAPLLTLAQAAGAQSTLMNKIAAATPVDGDPPAWSGVATTVGAPSSIGATSGGTVAPPNLNPSVNV